MTEPTSTRQDLRESYSHLDSRVGGLESEVHSISTEQVRHSAIMAGLVQDNREVKSDLKEVIKILGAPKPTFQLWGAMAGICAMIGVVGTIAWLAIHPLKEQGIAHKYRLDSLKARSVDTEIALKGITESQAGESRRLADTRVRVTRAEGQIERIGKQQAADRVSITQNERKIDVIDTHGTRKLISGAK